MSKEQVTLFYGYDDYIPVVVYSDKRGVLFQGDNMHDTGYREYALGYTEALNLNLNEVYVEEESDLDEHKELLESADVYKLFQNYFNF